MVSSINFRGDIAKTNTQEQPAQPVERVVYVPADNRSDSFVSSILKPTATIAKTYVTLKEATIGAAKTIATAGTAIVGVLGLDWVLNKAAGHGLKEQSIITTPFKAMGKIIKGSFGKVKDIANLPVKKAVFYPIVGFPKDVYNYVQSVKGGSKYSKPIALSVGLVLATIGAFGTMININRARADVDHGYRVGHNSK